MLFLFSARVYLMIKKNVDFEFFKICEIEDRMFLIKFKSFR